MTSFVAKNQKIHYNKVEKRQKPEVATALL